MAEMSENIRQRDGEVRAEVWPRRVAVFSPIYGIAGPVAGQRWWFLSRYLSAMGVEVTVFHHTPEPGTAGAVLIANGAEPQEVYVPRGRRLLRKLSDLADRAIVKLFGSRPGKLSLWARILAGRLYLASESAQGLLAAFERTYEGKAPPDLLITSFIGWSAVEASVRLSRRGIPLVFEFRDPWRAYENLTADYNAPRIRRAVSHAAALISVSPLWCRRDAEEFRKETLLIPHGYPREIHDALAHEVPADAGPAEPLRVGYFGTMLYPWFDCQTWCQGLRLLDAGVADFHYAGSQHEQVRGLCEREGVADRARIQPRIGLWDVYARQRSLDVLLAYSCTAPDNPEWFGYKLAEVRAAGRPVLVVGPPYEPLRQFLAAGTRVLWATTAAEVAAALGALAEEKRRLGAVACATNPAVSRTAGWDHIAGDLMRHLARLVPPRGPSGPAKAAARANGVSA